MSETVSYESLRNKYPCKSTEAEYVKHWEVFMPEVVARSNFQLSHLFLLESLCDMYVEKRRIEEYLQLVGYSYEGGEGRNGFTIKPRPEVSILARVRTEIRNYHRALGLSVKEPKGTQLDPEGAEDEWG